eukprot:GHVL01028577.1.p1 GENE.GHVL01028577.1~~GHVL01028577.1.p1  ORF type:complete len:106 (-),score=28.14 GHVL01028577.1:266-583(-)
MAESENLELPNSNSGRPSDEQLRNNICQIMSSTELSELSVNKIRQQLCTSFCVEDFDEEEKSFIRRTIDENLASRSRGTPVNKTGGAVKKQGIKPKKGKTRPLKK